MYGVEAIDINGGEIKKWEVIQNRVDRLVFRCKRYVAVEVIRGEMGWSSFATKNEVLNSAIST